MYIAILGRQPALGMAELEKLYDASQTRWFSDQSAIIETDSFSIDHLGGTQKAGRIVAELPHSDWHRTSTKIIQTYTQAWSSFDGKITLGISAYGFDVSARDIQKAGIVLKQKLKKANVSLRLIPNTETALNSATSHHNKLGLSENKVELIVIRARNGRVIIAESIGAQNITAYTRRDQGRPKRDAFVGMLPPKLAQIMVNLALPQKQEGQLRVLDPFCGTGVILQEAALMGHAVYGTDLSDKMIDFSITNLQWLAESHHIDIDASIRQGDAMDTKWQPPIDAVACESYLGQPFSAPPSPAKLDQVRKNCSHIIIEFLKNIASQIEAGTPLCVGIPAWRDTEGRFTHLPITDQLQQLGYEQYDFKNVKKKELLYYREDQVVARELLVLVKS
jgi:tRNA (guanine10-N2)-dimethyltransferase